MSPTEQEAFQVINSLKDGVELCRLMLLINSRSIPRYQLLAKIIVILRRGESIERIWLLLTICLLLRIDSIKNPTVVFSKRYVDWLIGCLFLSLKYRYHLIASILSILGEHLLLYWSLPRVRSPRTEIVSGEWSSTKQELDQGICIDYKSSMFFLLFLSSLWLLRVSYCW